MHTLQEASADSIEVTTPGTAASEATPRASGFLPAEADGPSSAKSYGQIPQVVGPGRWLLVVNVAHRNGPDQGDGVAAWAGWIRSVRRLWLDRNLAQKLAGMGVNSSGVRQIAELPPVAETRSVLRVTSQVLRRVSVLLGLLGALLIVVSPGL